MTTKSAPGTSLPAGGSAVVRGAASWGLAAAIAGICLALALDGSAAAAGAAIGGLGTIVVLAAGTWAVLGVSSISPVASLLAALVAFTAQGMLLLILLAVLSATTDGPQVSAAAFSVIAVTVVWTTMFAVLIRRARIPLFDLSQMGPVGASAAPPDAERPGTR